MHIDIMSKELSVLCFDGCAVLYLDKLVES